MKLRRGNKLSSEESLLITILFQLYFQSHDRPNNKLAMKPFTFDQIPKMMGKLFEKMERIELLLSNIPIGQGQKDELLTISEASKLLRLAIPTIYYCGARHST